MKNKIYSLLILSSILVSCDDDEIIPKQEDEEETITSVTMNFTDTLTKKTISFYFKDQDGSGGNEPSQFDTIRLAKNTFYNCEIKLSNESKANNIIDITEEIKEEGADHLFCYETSTQTIIQKTDTDGKYPIGLSTHWITDDKVEKGNTMISLKHQPGIKNGTCEIGETDIELNFHTIIE